MKWTGKRCEARLIYIRAKTKLANITYRAMISQRWLIASIVLILTSFSTPSAAQTCLNNGNYTSNSTYKANLETLFSSLPRNVGITGFYNASLGQSSDTAYAYALCRGDVQLESCRACIQDAIAKAQKTCPNYKQVVHWEDLCTLRYSNKSMFGILESFPLEYEWNSQNASRADQFMADVQVLLNSLNYQAAEGGSMRKVAAGNRSSVDSQDVYALVQCSPDLSMNDCTTCLTDSATDIPSFCPSKRGCKIRKPSCFLRYEITPFYDLTSFDELQTVTQPPRPPPQVLPPPPQTPTPGKKDNNTRKIIIVVVPTVVGLIVAVSAIILLVKRSKKPTEQPGSAKNINVAECLQYDFCGIKDATDDFSDANKLGEGGFGTVYKGMLPSGQEIAVKRLSMDSRQGDVEFKNEVQLVANLQHRNLVRLLGFSIEGKERLLVYEFVKNASLDRFIFDSVKRSVLDCARRCKIIAGVARGLLYLHEESRLKIIHRDLKVSNILLDSDMNPKISDFGMARLFVTDESQANTNRIVGTYGYMSPEYAMHGQFSVKSDVFSFGVLVLETVSGQRNVICQNGEPMEDLLSQVWKKWRQGLVEDIIDPVLRAGTSALREMSRCIHIGLLCVQDNPVDRPTMASVVLMLSSSTISLPVPLEPTFSVTSGYYFLNQINPSSISSGLNEPAQSTGSSKNTMSVTDQFYPR